MSSGAESNESSYLEGAHEYEGFAEEQESSDESTGEGQDAQDAGEGEWEQGDEGETPPEAGTDEPSFEVILPGGQKAQVPLSELVAGYSRTADYTRKTQTLAAERREMADALAITQALERNPAATIDALARAYGIGNGNGAQPEQDEFLTDDDRWRQQVNARFEAQDRDQRQAAIDREIGRLHQVYGDFNEEHLFTRAVQTNTMNLEVVLQAMQFESLRTQAERDAANRRNVKRAAAAAKGGGSVPGTQPAVEDTEIRSMQDAYRFARQILNRS